MSPTVEPLATLIAHLRADAPLAALTGGRIYGGDRPPSPDNLPHGAALTAHLDGGDAASDLPLSDVRIEVRCWGGLGPDGPARAVAIWRALRDAANLAHRAVGQAHVLWLIEVGGPVLNQDSNSNEAYVQGELRLATTDAPLT